MTTTKAKAKQALKVLRKALPALRGHVAEAFVEDTKAFLEDIATHNYSPEEYVATLPAFDGRWYAIAADALHAGYVGTAVAAASVTNSLTRLYAS